MIVVSGCVRKRLDGMNCCVKVVEVGEDLGKLEVFYCVMCCLLLILRRMRVVMNEVESLCEYRKLLRKLRLGVVVGCVLLFVMLLVIKMLE